MRLDKITLPQKITELSKFNKQTRISFRRECYSIYRKMFKTFKEKKMMIYENTSICLNSWLCTFKMS